MNLCIASIEPEVTFNFFSDELLLEVIIHLIQKLVQRKFPQVKVFQRYSC